MTSSAREAWRNRIVGHGIENPGDLLANPNNWRSHPQPQADALTGVLNEIGYVQAVIVNQRTGHLIDGHLRVGLALERDEPSIPVVYVDLSPEEELLILATLDPLGAMAGTDSDALDSLLHGVSSGDAAVMALLDSIGQAAGIVPAQDPNAEWQGMPEFEHEDKTAYRSITVHFKDQDAVDAFSEIVGQMVTPKTRFLWYPEIEIERYADKAYVGDDNE